MRYIHLLYFSLAVAILVVVGYSLVGDPDLRRTLVSVAVINAKGFAAFGAFMGMMRFERGDYLRKAWAATFVYSIAFMEADLWVLLVGPHLGADATSLGRGILIIICNVLTVWSILLFARAATVSGLFAATSRTQRVLTMLPAAGVALAIAGPPTWLDAVSLFQGDLGGIARVISSLGDMASFILIAPLVVTVVRLRGSPLRWPFVFLAASEFCWLFFDLGDLVLRTMFAQHSTPPIILANVQDAWRILACLFIFSAGVSQSIALRASQFEARRPRASRAAA